MAEIKENTSAHSARLIFEFQKNHAIVDCTCAPRNLRANLRRIKMVFKSSQIWTMSSANLIEHLSSLDAPDQIYWDSRELKRKGQKFQSLDWCHWPKSIKFDGQWTFAKKLRGAGESDVANRIEQAPACEVINLAGAEKDVYHGAGWMLARFENGVMVELFDPMRLPYEPDFQKETDAMASATQAWLGSAVGEVWLVSCSCYQLCEPRRVTVNDAAYVLRVFAEQSLELMFEDSCESISTCLDAMTRLAEPDRAGDGESDFQTMK